MSGRRAPSDPGDVRGETVNDPEGPASAPSQLGGLAAGVPGEPAGIESDRAPRFGELSFEAGHRASPPSRGGRLPRQRSPRKRWAVTFDVPARAKTAVMSTWDSPKQVRFDASDRRSCDASFSALADNTAPSVIYGGVIGRELASPTFRAQGGIMTLERPLRLPCP